MQVTTIQSFLDYFNKVRERTMRLVAYIPPDKVEWRAAPGKFTLGDLARHIAATERNLGVLGVTVPPLYGLTSEQLREIGSRTKTVET